MIKCEAEKVNTMGKEEMSIDIELDGSSSDLLNEMGGIVSAFIFSMLNDKEIDAAVPAGKEGLEVMRGVYEHICDVISEMAIVRAEKRWAKEHGVDTGADVPDEQSAGQ